MKEDTKKRKDKIVRVVTRSFFLLIGIPIFIIGGLALFFYVSSSLKDYSIQKRAEEGDASAQYELGMRYERELQRGREIPQDGKEAVKWFRLAAEQGHAHAQSNMGSRFYEGRDVTQNKKEALNLFKLSAENGIVTSQLYLGWMYYQGIETQKDDHKAFKWWKLAAEGVKVVQQNYEENDEDQNSLYRGQWNMYSIENFSEYSLLQRSENALGQMYEQGRIVQQDYKEAVRWYRHAIRKQFLNDYCMQDCYIYSHYPEAPYNLGLMYANGQGVPKDYLLAYMWWSIANSDDARYYNQICINAGMSKKNISDCAETNGYKNAMKRKKLLEKEMTLEQIEKAKEMARNWKAKK